MIARVLTMIWGLAFVCQISFASDIQWYSKKRFADEPLWKHGNKTGQILGISEKTIDPSTAIFELATGFQIGHVGIAVTFKDLEQCIHDHPELDPRSAWKRLIKSKYDGGIVFHSDPSFRQKEDGGNGRGGVGFWLTNDFVGRGMAYSDEPDIYGFEFGFMQIQPKDDLSPELKDKLITTLLSLYERSRDNKLEYNFAQTMQALDPKDGLPRRLNCSEFVHYVFYKIGMQVGRPQQMKTLNLTLGRGLLKHYFRLSGLYNPEAWCITPKSVMQSAVYNRLYNPSPEFEACACSQLDPAITQSEHEIVTAWLEKGEWKLFELRMLDTLGTSTVPFEEDSFYQSFDSAVEESNAATNFYRLGDDKALGSYQQGNPGRDLALAVTILALGGLGIYGASVLFL